MLAALKSPANQNCEFFITYLLDDIAEKPDDLALIHNNDHVIKSCPENQAMTFLLNHLLANMHPVIATHATTQYSRRACELAGGQPVCPQYYPDEV